MVIFSRSIYLQNIPYTDHGQFPRHIPSVCVSASWASLTVGCLSSFCMERLTYTDIRHWIPSSHSNSIACVCLWTCDIADNKVISLQFVQTTKRFALDGFKLLTRKCDKQWCIATWGCLSRQSFPTFGGVTRGRGGPPRLTPSRGDTRRKKIVGKFTRNSGETRSDR